MKRCLLCMLLLAAPALAVEPMAVPRIEDPTPIIDGDLADWRDRGAPVILEGEAHATYRPALWRGNDDLSARMQVAYDGKYLFLAAEVTDDVVSQPMSGYDIWQGDHVTLLFDFARSGDDKRLIQLGISPGDLQGGAAKPQAVAWRPDGIDLSRAVVAARRTADGYIIEAAIAWVDLGITPALHTTFGIEVAVSDNDTDPPAQKTVISRNPRNWLGPSLDRLGDAALASRTGKLPAGLFDFAATTLAGALSLEPQAQQQFTVHVDEPVAGRAATLTFRARIDYDKPAGCIAGLGITINGRPLTKDNLPNRPLHMQLVSGISTPSFDGRSVVLFYTPDFDSIDRSNYAPMGFSACDYTLRLDGLIEPGDNVITIANTCHVALRSKPLTVVMADVAFSWSTPARFKPPKQYAPAPTGALDVFEPRPPTRAVFQVDTPNDATLNINGIAIHSRYSRPDGTWADWTDSGDLSIARRVERTDELIAIYDTLTNRGNDVLPVMIEHSAAIDGCEKLYIAGRPLPTGTGSNHVPENPSVVVLRESDGFAIIAHDDIFRLHADASYDGSAARLTDRSLALRPGVTYEHRWIVVPLDTPDYWQFVNRMRRHDGVNFAIPGSFAFFMFHDEHTRLLPWEAVDWLNHKAARFVCVFLNSQYHGYYAQGATKRFVDPTTARMTNRLLRAIRPDSQLITYFNCFDYTQLPGTAAPWPEAVVLRPDGKPVRGDEVHQVYMPIEGSAYGDDLMQTVEWSFNELEADGFWWDMYNGYGTHYGEPWDGWTVDIDPRTHRMTRRKSSTALLTWPWREALTRRMIDEGRPLTINGSPMIHSELQYHVPRVVETADIGRLSKSHLFTPIALGDHITEKSEADCYRHMLRALDWGGLYYWYSTTVTPTRPTLTSYMFPFTPIELHSGYLIGEERILTNRSGLFGWGDDSDFEAHVFNRVGAEVDDVTIPRVMRDGKAYAQVRIAEGYSVALVRREQY